MKPLGVAGEFTGLSCYFGTFHLFTLPSPTISVGSLAVGADGDLWFTDVSNMGGPSYAYSNKIGRLTPSGVFTEFPLTLRKATDFINLLIAGPDGNLWFSIDSYLPDYSAFGEMGRITQQGALTIFDLGRQKDWTKVPKSGTFVL